MGNCYFLSAVATAVADPEVRHQDRHLTLTLTLSLTRTRTLTLPQVRRQLIDASFEAAGIHAAP